MYSEKNKWDVGIYRISRVWLEVETSKSLESLKDLGSSKRTGVLGIKVELIN